MNAAVPLVDTIVLDDLVIEFTRKDVKHVHLSVHPPHGRITLVAPRGTRIDVARAYAITRLGWMRKQLQTLRDQARETPRQFVTRESHYLWGRRYLLRVVEREGKPAVTTNHKNIVLAVRPGTDREKRAEILHEWHKTQLHAAIPPLISTWERRLGVSVSGYFCSG